MHVEDFGPAPLTDPTVYPGKWPDQDLLMVGQCLFPLNPVAGRRIEQYRVEECGCSRPRSFGSNHNLHPLSYALLRANATPMSMRRPFLSVGSNANPTQLYKKLHGKSVSTVVPLTQVDVKGLAVGFSDHLFHVNEDVERCTGSYVPTTAVPDKAATRKLFLAWLDKDQALALNSTEDNYVTDIFRSPHYTFTLNSDEQLDAVIGYVSKWGPKRDDEGLLIELDADREKWAQQQVYLLASHQARSETPKSDNSSDWTSCEEYRNQGGVTGNGALVLPTDSRIERNGDSIAALPPQHYDALSKPGLLWVSPTTSEGVPLKPSIVVRARVDKTLDAGQVRLDQIPRNALGVEIRERVNIQPVKTRRFDPGAILARHPVYTVCRVQAAPLVVMERGIVLLDPLAMEIIGVESGDQVVLEGVPRSPNQEVPRERLRAVAASANIVEDRKELIGGGAESRFPSTLDTLGVSPDLAWAFIDQATRARLNLDGSRVSVVRVRASRRDLLFKETRELVLLLAIAALGLLALIEEPVTRLISIGTVLAVGVGIIATRLRRRVAKARG